MGFFDSIIGIGKAIAQPFVNGGRTVINTIGSAGKSIGSGVGKLFKGDFGGALSEGKNVINTIGKGAQSLADEARNIPYIGGQIASFIDPVAGQIKSFGGMGNNLIDKIGGVFGYQPESDQQKQDATQAQNNMSELPYGSNDVNQNLYLTKGKFKTQPYNPQPPVLPIFMQQPAAQPSTNIFAIPSGQNEVIRTTAPREPQATQPPMIPITSLLKPKQLPPPPQKKSSSKKKKSKK